MPVLDFTEIATAQFGPDRDQFELFARDFLVLLGFQVESGPDRGPDAGRDMIVIERRAGVVGTTDVRWLVSCKHKAPSGQAVLVGDEQNIRDRLETHRCNGFLAIYSTVVSSGLTTNINLLKPRFEAQIYERERIEQRLLDDGRGRLLAARYMPASYNKWVMSFPADSRHPVQNLTITAGSELNSYFLRPPHHSLAPAIVEAVERDTLVFIVIFDAAHPTRSKLTWTLGHFAEFNATKQLIDQYFTVVIASNEAPDLRDLVPDDEPLEECLWVVMTPSHTIVRREPLYANPQEGLKRIREVIARSGKAS